MEKKIDIGTLTRDDLVQLAEKLEPFLQSDNSLRPKDTPFGIRARGFPFLRYVEFTSVQSGEGEGLITVKNELDKKVVGFIPIDPQPMANVRMVRSTESKITFATSVTGIKIKGWVY